LLRHASTIRRKIGIAVASRRYAMTRPRSAQELVRGALESGGDVRSAVRSFRAGDGARFFFDAGEPGGIARQLEALAPGWTAAAVADADRITGGVVRLLGADAVDVRSTVDRGHGIGVRWHEDVLSGHRWNPRQFYKQVAVPYGVADIKVPWELSRCQHLPTLGMAYAATGDGRYAQAVVEWVDDWIASNPWGYGVNWSCAMDVSIRAINWLWAYRMVDDARHIDANVEHYAHGVTTNHTLADYLGLLYLGVLLPRCHEAPGWADRGAGGLVACMESQVHPDGVDFENSIPYHRLVTEMFLSGLVLAQRNGRTLPDAYAASLERMLEFTLAYSRPDGLAPLVGDSDDGRLQILSRYFDWRPQDHLYLLGPGAALFSRSDFAAAASKSPLAAAETAWLAGIDAARRVTESEGRAVDTRSQAFPDGGRYVMRDGANQVLICADQVGSAGLGNHKHNDILSYELSVDGVALVVDPGSYLYTSDLTWRNSFRSTRAHNTVMVDGVEQNDMTEAFGMRAQSEVHVHEWRCGPEADVFEAAHTGYRRLADPVEHRRRFVFAKRPSALLVLDTLLGDSQHVLESFVHFGPDGEFAPVGDSRPVRLIADAALSRMSAIVGTTDTLEARPDGAVTYRRDGVTVAVVPVNWGPIEVTNGWVAPRYGQRVGAPVAALSAPVEAGAAVGYLVLPC
jgi:hypothetical protein